MNMTSFEGFDLPAPLATCLGRMNYTTPTPIQAKAIPFALDGRDIMGSAQTGTGKTAAFCIPMIAALINDPRACAMVMTPTRELAMQVLDVARQMIAGGTNIRTALLIGGEPMSKQFKQLNDRPRLIVGTPGRMNDHLRRNPELFEDTSFVVLDEADRMLDMGFSVQIDTILAAAPAQRQTLMFSATFPAKIEKFARTYLENPQRVEIESQKITAENISHDMIEMMQNEKYDVLRVELEARTGSIIVFVKTKHGADKLAAKLRDDGHDATALHGGLNQRQRERATRAFRKMEFRVMIATDVAARGLDIPHVEHVINYDMPMVAEDYIHRIGRTARAGAKGQALALVTPADRGLWMDVQRVMYPGTAPVRSARGGQDERGEGRKPMRKNPYKKASFGKGGFNKGGFKKREDGEGRTSFGGDRPAYNNDRARPAEGQQGGFKKREDGERNYAGRTSFNDRPRGPKPVGAQGGFKKREDGASRGSFNGDRPAYNADRPRSDKPYAPREGYKKREGGEQQDGNRSSFNDRPYSAKPAGKKFAGKKPEGNFQRSDKPRSDKPRSDKPQGARRGAARYNNDAGKGNGGQTFRKRNAA